MRDVLIKPVITEKSMAAAQAGKFTFVVDAQADKKTIKSAVEKTFNVQVVGIVTAHVKGKRKRVGTRRTEKRETPIKKAMVKLATGQKIGLFELGGE
jgi:large subunit ribosomal protein L23